MGAVIEKLIGEHGAKLVGHINTVKHGDGLPVPAQGRSNTHQMLFRIGRTQTVVQNNPALLGQFNVGLVCHIGQLGTDGRKGITL